MLSFYYFLTNKNMGSRKTNV